MQIENVLTNLTRLAKRNPSEFPKLTATLSASMEDFALPALDVASTTGDPMGQALLAALETP
jgi:hypothetical protein